MKNSKITVGSKVKTNGRAPKNLQNLKGIVMDIFSSKNDKTGKEVKYLKLDDNKHYPLSYFTLMDGDNIIEVNDFKLSKDLSQKIQEIILDLNEKSNLTEEKLSKALSKLKIPYFKFKDYAKEIQIYFTDNVKKYFSKVKKVNQ